MPICPCPECGETTQARTLWADRKHSPNEDYETRMQQIKRFGAITCLDCALQQMPN